MEEQAGRLVPLLLDLVAFVPAAAVRQTALESLAAMALLLPPPVAEAQRSAAAAAARRSLDDNKRSVRAAALQCRTAWGA